MTDRIYEIPGSLVKLLRLVGPIHEEVTGGYAYRLSVVVGPDETPAGFLIEQRMAEPTIPEAKGQGISFKSPQKADPRSEATYAFVNSLPAALEYVRRNRE